jgi:rSAM/selenodomain-associated transferase 1
MAKYPEPGGVKTRLARVIGPEVACRLYRAFLRDLAARLAALPCAVSWAYWPPASPFPAMLPGARCRPQRGENLGERMATALAEEFLAATGPVLMIGVDAPHLPAAVLGEAAAALTGGADVVLGPALDGGYYLIGLRAPRPALFQGIPWSTPGVMQATLAAVHRLGLRPHLLPPSFDVDEPADLECLRDVLARGEVSLPETAGVLADIPPATPA